MAADNYSQSDRYEQMADICVMTWNEVNVA
jgi:hypothetical protein